MDIGKWTLLLAVLDCGSLSGAAEQFGYTPSGVSRAVASLEEECGFPLLARQRRGVAPTRECRLLLPHVRRLLSSARILEAETASIRGLETGSLTIGSSYGAYDQILAAWIASFRTQHPGITVELFGGASSELAAAVENGRCDLCVISRRPGSFEWISLARDELTAVLPAGHAFAKKNSFPLARFAEEAFIEIMPDKETDNSLLFRSENIRPKKTVCCADTFAALTMVEAGLGVTLINRIILDRWQGNVIAIPLSPRREVEIGIASPPLPEASPAARSFLAYIREQLAARQVPE